MRLPQEQKLDVVQFRQDKASYDYWFRKQFGVGDDEEYLGRISKLIASAIEHELTDIQRTYLSEYYFEGLTMAEIAEIYGTNKSTISRTIARARNRIGRCLKYADPRLMKAFVRGDRPQLKRNTVKRRSLK